MSNEEITYEQVMEYCGKRNLVLIDYALLLKLYNNGNAIPVEWIKDWLKKRKYCIANVEDLLEDWEAKNEQALLDTKEN